MGFSFCWAFFLTDCRSDGISFYRDFVLLGFRSDGFSFYWAVAVQSTMPSTFRDPKAYNKLIRGVLLAIRLGANFHFFLIAKHSPHSSSIAFPSTFPFHALTAAKWTTKWTLPSHKALESTGSLGLGGLIAPPKVHPGQRLISRKCIAVLDYFIWVQHTR